MEPTTPAPVTQVVIPAPTTPAAIQAAEVRDIPTPNPSSVIVSITILAVTAMAASIAAFIWAPGDAIAISTAAFGFAISITTILITLSRKVENVHSVVNSRMTEMLALQREGVEAKTKLEMADAQALVKAAIAEGLAEAERIRTAATTATEAAALPAGPLPVTIVDDAVPVKVVGQDGRGG